jgi:hypothetical protein
MATSEGLKVDPKTIGLILAVVALLALAIWQGSRTLVGNPSERSFTPAVQPPPDSQFTVTNPEVGRQPEESGDKTGDD